MRSKGTTSNIFSEQTDIEEARTYEEPEQPEVEKCATPVVTYAEGKLSFSCETEGANYVTKLVAEDAKEYYDA